MAKDIEVGVRLTADSKGLVGESRAAQGAIKGIAEIAKTANTESAAAAERFTANLKRQADTLGMTASQIRTYDAAQLKLNEAQRASVEASNRAITAHEKTHAAARANVDVLGSLRANLMAATGAYVSYAAVMAGGKAIIDTAIANDRLNNTLKVGTGSAEAAARETTFLRQETERLGLQYAITAEQYAKLTAASRGTTLEGQATRDIFLGIAKASTVLNLSADQTGGALLAIQQMISKGTVAAEELRGQLGERLPGAFQMAARALGVTTSELDKMLIKGEVTAERLLPALALELEKTFGAQSQEAAQGLNAKINRLDNSFTDLKTVIGNTGLLDLLSSGIVLATRFVDALSGAKVLSAIDAQKQKIIEMRAELESMGNRKHIPLIGDLIFDKKQADLLSQRIDDAIGDLQRLEKEADEATGKAGIVTPGAKPALPDSIVKELEKQTSAREKAATAAAKQAQQAVESSNRIIASLKLETEQIGLNAIQKRMMSAAAEAAKAPTKELANEIMGAAAAWGYAAQQQENLQIAEKERVDGLKAIEQAEKAAARASEDAARKSAAEWNQLWGGVEQTAKTAFVQFAAHGKSAMESIGESIKIAILDVLYQLTVRKWVINIGASLSGMVGAGAANAAASGGFDLMSAANLGSSALNLVKGGFGVPGFIGNLGSSLPGSAGSFFTGMAGKGATQLAAESGAMSLWGASGASTGMAASMGSAFAAAAGPLMVAYLGTQLFRGLAGDKRLGGGFGKAINAIGDIPILGDFMPLVPLLNGLFGRGPLKQKETSLTGSIGMDGFESGMLQTRFQAKGGLFRSNKTDFARVDAITGEIWTDNQKQLGEFAKGLSKAAREIFGAFNDAAKQTSDVLNQVGGDLGLSTDALKGFNYEINLVSEKGKSLTEEQISQEIENLTDAMARKLLPQVDELAKRGETALQTVARLGTEFTSLVDAATLVLGRSAADARAMILGASFEGRTGFVDAAGGTDALGQMAQYFAANFLTESERLAPAQEALTAELNNLGLSADLTRDQFRDLVQSFGQVDGVAEDVLISLLKLAPAFIDVRTTQDALAQSARDLERDLEQANRAALLSSAASAYQDLQKSVDVERNRITEDYNDAVQESDRRIQNITQSISKLKSLSDALKSTVDQIQPIGRDAAKQQIIEAINIARRGGELPDAESLRGALDVLGNSETITGARSSFEFALEQAKTAILIGDLGRLTDKQLTTEERSLSALESQRDRLNDGFKEEIARLDALLEQGAGQIDAMNGLNQAILSLTQAIGQFNLRAVQAGGTPIVDPATGRTPISGNPRISDQQIRDYVNAPGRDEMDIYNAARRNGVSFTQFAAATGKNIADLEAWADAKNLPKFASGGLHSGGLRIVGERGPELEFTGPSRIASNNELNKMLSNDNVVAELRTLIAEIKTNNDYNRRVANKLDAVTQGGTALRTKAA